jgi:peptide/nickel transport system substrate-binding protein
MFKEYVIGSHMAFKRNPNYWKTTTIDGKVYKMPFVDELVIPIIPDISTQMAALRTGKLDMHERPPVEHWKDLESTAPDLKFGTGAGWGRHVAFDTRKKPFDNRDVRRAIMIGTDIKAFGDMHGIGDRPVHWYPQYPPYVKLEDLPQETRMLYDYNPELARKMLDEAGVPRGFKMTLEIESAPEFTNKAAVLKDQWAKIGIELNIKALESVTWRAHLDKRDGAGYADTIISTQAAANPAELFRYAPGAVFDIAQWKDDKFSELTAKATSELDPEKRDKLISEGSIYILNEVPYLPLDLTPIKYYWWPWLKNYYGEWNLEDGGLYPVVPYIWLDQAMKKSMGY